jgi:hypothetical protein
MGCWRLRLVLLEVLPCHFTVTKPSREEDMALAHIAFVFVAVCVFALSNVSLGNIILRLLRLEMDTEIDHLLISAGLGVLSVEVLLFLAEWTQHIRAACLFIAILLCISLLGLKPIASKFWKVWEGAPPLTSIDRVLLAAIAAIIAAEFMTCLAPLTGSDALHYHFTAQKLILNVGFFPEYSILHSFLCGQSHLLILFGLALRSEKLAMGLIFLGGLYAALALFSFVSRLVSRAMALAFVVLFLVTPIVFWQITSAGAPDIWMAFFATSAIVVLCQEKMPKTWQRALLVGLLTGGVAGAKYTGCIVAGALALATAIEYRSALRALPMILGSLLTGVWPYLRNFVWTKDPVFPYLYHVLYPEHVNSFALHALQVDTGAAHSMRWGPLLAFLFFAGAQTESLGFWDFFGPLVFALFPLILFALEKFNRLRLLAIVWFLSAFGVFCVSGLPRFLLVVFPLGLVCTAVGIDSARKKSWKLVSGLAIGLLTFLCVFGCAGLAMYSSKALPVVLGRVSEARYLEENRPEYQQIERINRAVNADGAKGKTLLFARHTYSLDIPFLNGDPATSWMIDPARLRTPQDWEVFFHQQGIAYVVRAPKYPEAIESSLKEMEADGELLPLTEFTVEDFHGMRIKGNRVQVPVTIFRIKDFGAQ